MLIVEAIFYTAGAQ